VLIRPHDIAICNAEGLIFYCCGFFFFWRLISEVTERISAKLGHIFTYDCYLKNLVWTPRTFTPTGWEAKTLFGTNFALWPNISLQRNMISTIGKKLINLQGLPYMPPKLGEIWSRNGWGQLASFCLPPNFSHWETLPALPHDVI